MPGPNRELIEQVRRLADGTKSSNEIAATLGRNPRHIRKILTKHSFPRLPQGSPTGSRNAAFAGGRRITAAGYVQVTAPEGHPYAKVGQGKVLGWIFEHRLVLEGELGRYLHPSERVDHLDGLTLHNHPDNLRVFASNADHLHATLTGKVPQWSEEGYGNMLLRHRQPEGLQRVDIHRQRTAAGATRLRQILLAALRLGTDSPYLCGTQQWLEKAGIDVSSRSTIERALVDLCERWGWAPPL